MSSQQSFDSLLTAQNKKIGHLMHEIRKVIVGQDEMIQGILIGLFTGGHILIEGLPGLAKTLSISTMAKAVSLLFKRVQFTPDLLPSDIVGTMVFHSAKQDFTPKKGPIFTNILLADEINRAPAKVQSALLEAMEERQVSLGDQSHPLPQPFLVLATQNPIEQEGTYSLPEAQRDRFLLQINVHYPEENEELAILNQSLSPSEQQIFPILRDQDVLDIQKAIQNIHIADEIKKYIVELVTATRDPAACGLPEIKEWIETGASPRATVNFPKAARALAFFENRHFVSLDDIKRLAPSLLRHRLILSYEAGAENITADHVINKILKELK